MTRLIGEGSVYPVKKDDNSKHRYSFWYLDHGGEKKREAKTIRGSKSKVRRMMNDRMREVDAGLDLSGAKTTFAKFANDEYHAIRKSNGEVKRSTLDKELRTIRTLSRHIGQNVLIDITPRRIDRVLADIREEGEYSGTTMRDIYVKLKSIMGKAVDYELILSNPCNKVKPPKVDTADVRYLSAEEMVLFLDEIEKLERQESDISKLIAMRMYLASGARRGEILALSWKHFDLTSGRILIEDSLNEYGELGGLKTSSSRREIKIEDSCIKRLRLWRVEQAGELRGLGVKQTEDTPIVTNGIGGYLDPHKLSDWWKRQRKNIALTPQGEARFIDVTIKSLRHTVATQMAAMGMSQNDLQEYMGHASYETTAKYYTHVLPGADKKIANSMTQLITTQRAKMDEYKQFSDTQARFEHDFSVVGRSMRVSNPLICKNVGPPSGFEPLTPALGELCSIP